MRLLVVLFLGMLISPVHVKAQQQFQPVLVQIPAISEGRQLQQLEQLFDSIPGIGHVSYCNSLQLAIIQTTGNPDSVSHLLAVRLRHAHFRFALKPSVDFGIVQSKCH